MSKAICAPKLHHFYPLASNLVVRVKAATSGGGATQTPGYKSVIIPTFDQPYQFDSGFEPSTVHDLIVQRLDGTTFANRIIQTGTPENPIWSTGDFTYDQQTRTLTPLVVYDQPVVLHSFNHVRSSLMNDQWVTVTLNTVQGIGYADEFAGTFQGGYRCCLEILSYPEKGILRYSDSRQGFCYRPVAGSAGRQSFQYKLVNAMQQESDAACVFLDIQ